MNIAERLFEFQDNRYADFQSKLIPGIERERLIGVRVPVLRKIAKELYRNGSAAEFLDTLPHYYYEENMLHGLILSEISDYNKCIDAMDKFLPYVNNWAVCDTMSPKVFKEHKTELIGKIQEWIKSDKTYTIRFGIRMLMVHFLDNEFKPEYLKMPAEIKSSEYYVRMMQSWFFATALAKQWDASIPYLQNKELELWTHNKTIQKACESFRITDKQKKYLKTLKR